MNGNENAPDGGRGADNLNAVSLPNNSKLSAFTRGFAVPDPTYTKRLIVDAASEGRIPGAVARQLLQDYDLVDA